jgi:hypothetical protein
MRTGEVIRAWLLSCSSGLLLGVAARLTMRFVALESGVSPEFSLGGSLEVVIVGALIATPVSLLFFAFRTRVVKWRPWVGVVCGLSLFALLAAWPPPAARSALAATPDTPSATTAAFAVVFLAWGLLLEVLAPRLSRIR